MRRRQHNLTDAEFAAWFWSKTAEASSRCREWTGSLTRVGYGQVQRNGRMLKTHRVSYELAFGPIPDGMCICHRCDNRRCVNPEHLFLGTHADNAADKMAKGRHRTPHGEKHGRRKLALEQVRAIRRMSEDGHSGRAIAKKFLVSTATVSLIINNKVWNHQGELT